MTYFSSHFRFKKIKAFFLVFVFCRRISNAICDPVLYFLFEGLNILLYDGTIPFQYLKTVVAMQDSTLPETGSQFIFQR